MNMETVIGLLPYSGLYLVIGMLIMAIVDAVLDGTSDEINEFLLAAIALTWPVWAVLGLIGGLIKLLAIVIRVFGQFTWDYYHREQAEPDKDATNDIRFRWYSRSAPKAEQEDPEGVR